MQYTVRWTSYLQALMTDMQMYQDEFMISGKVVLSVLRSLVHLYPQYVHGKRLKQFLYLRAETQGPHAHHRNAVQYARHLIK